jgi:predicted house-cleaning NTP pyrophosphatase (Maf/HAM1 superfamily)
MLLPYLKTLNSKAIILGSQSKTRNELMTPQRLKYSVIPSKFEENLDKGAYQDASIYNLVQPTRRRILAGGRSMS